MSILRKRQFQEIKNFIKKSKINVNKKYFGRTLVSTLIDNIIDDDELFNILFERGASINYNYFKGDFSMMPLIEKNEGLIKSFVHHGIMIKKDQVNKVIRIDTPVLFFIDHYNENIVKKLLSYGASVNEMDKDGMTPLFYTIKYDKIDLLKHLIKIKHADITIKNKAGETPYVYALKMKNVKGNKDREMIACILEKVSFLKAVEQKDYSTLKLILESYTKDNIKNIRYNGRPVIFYLIDNEIDCEEFFNLLFEQGSFISYGLFTNKSGVSPLLENNTGLMKSILRNGIKTKLEKTGTLMTIKTPIIFFTKIYYSRLVERMLEIHEASVNETDEEGWTPIFHAMNTNNLRLFRILLNKFHPDLTVRNKEGLTPLMFAYRLNKNEDNHRNLFISELKRSQANGYGYGYSYGYGFNNSSSSSSSPSSIDIKSNETLNSNEFREKDPVIDAVTRKKDLETIKRIIREKSPDNINDKIYKGKTLLSLVIDSHIDNEEIFDMLFEKMAMIDYKYFDKRLGQSYLIATNSGFLKSIIRHSMILYRVFGEYRNEEIIIERNPLRYCIQHFNNDIAEKLLEHGVPSNEFDVGEEEDNERRLPLTHAILNLNVRIFKLLLERYHPDIHKRDRNGYTPVHYMAAQNLSHPNNKKVKLMETDLKHYDELRKNGNLNSFLSVFSTPTNDKPMNCNRETNEKEDNQNTNDDHKSGEKEDSRNINDKNEIHENKEDNKNKKENDVIENEHETRDEKEDNNNKKESDVIGNENKTNENEEDYNNKKENVIGNEHETHENKEDNNYKKESDVIGNEFETNENEEDIKNTKEENVIKNEHETHENKEDNNNKDENMIGNEHETYENKEDYINKEENENDNINENENIDENENENIDENDNENENKYQKLRTACIEENIELIHQLLKKNSNDINEPCAEDGSTPLLLSIKYGKLKSIQELLKYEPDLTKTDHHHETPLSYILKYEIPSTDWDKDKDRDKDKDKDEDKDRDKNKDSDKNKDKDRICHELLSLLLPKLSIDQTYAPDNLTPLYYLLKYEKGEGISILSKTQKDFSIDELNEQGDTPLLYLIKDRPRINLSLIETVLTYQPNINYEPPTSYQTPLLCAIERDHLELIRLLLRHPVDLDHPSKNHVTPIKLAITLNKTTIARELLMARAARNGGGRGKKINKNK